MCSQFKPHLLPRTGKLRNAGADPPINRSANSPTKIYTQMSLYLAHTSPSPHLSPLAGICCRGVRFGLPWNVSRADYCWAAYILRVSKTDCQEYTYIHGVIAPPWQKPQPPHTLALCSAENLCSHSHAEESGHRSAQIFGSPLEV